MAVALTVGLLLVGGAAGFGLAQLAGHRGGHPWWRHHGPAALTEHYRQRLGLDPAQAKAVRKILEARWAETAAVLRRMDPQLEAIRHKRDTEIRAVLHPGQAKRFDAMVARHAARRAKMLKSLDLATGAARTPAPDPPR